MVELTGAFFLTVIRHSSSSELGSRLVSLPWKHRKNAVEAM